MKNFKMFFITALIVFLDVAVTPNICRKKEYLIEYDIEVANFDENAVGNAQNVVDMLGTRNLKMTELGNMSLEDFYTSLVGKVAAGGSNAEALVDTQQAVVDSIYDKILSNNSVDLNEELVDLVKYQTAYSAAAQVFNTCNSCLDTLMTLGG